MSPRFFAQSLACTLGEHHNCPVQDVHGNPCPCVCHKTTHAVTRTTDTRVDR